MKYKIHENIYSSLFIRIPCLGFLSKGIIKRNLFTIKLFPFFCLFIQMQIKIVLKVSFTSNHGLLFDV